MRNSYTTGRNYLFFVNRKISFLNRACAFDSNGASVSASETSDQGHPPPQMSGARQVTSQLITEQLRSDEMN